MNCQCIEYEIQTWNELMKFFAQTKRSFIFDTFDRPVSNFRICKNENSQILEFSNFRILKNEKTKSGYTDPE